MSGAIAEIRKIIRDFADDGDGVIVISSYLPEILDLSDRVLVAKGGPSPLNSPARTQPRKPSLTLRSTDAQLWCAECQNLPFPQVLSASRPTRPNAQPMIMGSSDASTYLADDPAGVREGGSQG